jgi:hypothetical protein
MYLNALGQPMVVLHSLKAASELLDRRARIYSGRPRFIVTQDILCGGLFTALMPYGELLVWPFLLNSEFIVILVVGVAVAAPHMKYSQRK